MKLWDRFSGPIDQDAIKTEFFRKIHCKNPPFRIKIKLNKRKRIKVPAMVLHHYKNPIPLLPSLRDVLRLENVWTRNNEIFEETEKVNGHLNGQILDKEDVLNGITKIKEENFCNGNVQIDMKLPDVVSGIHVDSK